MKSEDGYKIPRRKNGWRFLKIGEIILDGDLCTTPFFPKWNKALCVNETFSLNKANAYIRKVK